VRLVGVRLSGFQEGPAQKALAAFGIAWTRITTPRLHDAGLVVPRASCTELRWTSLAAYA
jgi:hypothetical protein